MRQGRLRVWLRTHAGWFVVLMMWTGGQLLLYGTRGGFWNHYWLPYLLGVAALNAGAFASVIRHAPRGWSAVAVVSLVLWCVNGVRINLPATRNFAIKASARLELIEAVAAALPRRGRVLIVSDQRTHSEWAYATMVFLGIHDRPESTVYLYDVGEPGNRRFSTAFSFPQDEQLARRESCSFDVVVYLDRPTPSDPTWSSWYQEECFVGHSVRRELAMLSGRQRGWARIPFSLRFDLNTARSE